MNCLSMYSFPGVDLLTDSVLVVVVVDVPVLQVAVLVVVAVDVLALALALSSSRCLLFLGCDSKDMAWSRNRAVQRDG